MGVVFRVDRFKALMKRYEITASEIAAVTNLCCAKSVLDNDNGTKWKFADINNEELFAICKLCNCTSDYLLGLGDNIN